MNKRRFAWIAGPGCVTLILIVLVGLTGLLFFSYGLGGMFRADQGRSALTIGVMVADTPAAEAAGATGSVSTPTPAPVGDQEGPSAQRVIEGLDTSLLQASSLDALYQDVNPGVVSIQVYVEQAGLTGSGAGSGFVIDDEGHIVTNQHVVAEANVVTVVFYEGTEVEAEIVGTDADSDLALVKVGQLPAGVHPLSLGASSAVRPGDWVIAIGNPFSLGSSMTLGIVSAVGRTIPTAGTPFSIPSAIQTDAAVNPGNSGGPLLTTDGQVVGVNAQIQSTTGTNSGVGFAIPSDVVELVVQTLIEQGTYAWPWLGVSGTDVSLLVQEANDLETQEGAYIDEVVENSPAAEAGLRGSTGQRRILGQVVPVGGDVIVEADGKPIEDFTDVLTTVAFRQPGETVELSVLRDGEQRQVTVELAERPQNLRG
mgnify:CR=1 FL=1